MLLSGGGNDLLGGSRLTTAVLPFESDRPAEAYLGDAFDANLTAVLSGYEHLFSRLQQVAPQTPILTHVYDHAVPANGRWLGRPLADIGIVDPVLQREIVCAIVDRFHAALVRLADTFAVVRVIDTRGSVHDDRWHDELHPTDDGYRSVARLFADAIAQATRTEPPDVATEAALEAIPRAVSDDAERALLLLGQHQEPAFLREIGRRESLTQASDPLSEEPLAVYPSSLEGLYPDLEELGQRVVAAASQVAFAMCCGSGEQARSALEERVRAGPAAVVRHLATVLAAQSAPASFSEAAGRLAGRRAHDYAQSVIGQPENSAIYFSVDFDASSNDLRDRIVPHFRGNAEALAEAGGGPPFTGSARMAPA